MSDIKASGALQSLLNGLAHELMRTSADDCKQAATALSSRDTVAHQALGAAVRHVSRSKDEEDPRQLWRKIYAAAQDKKRHVTAGHTLWRNRHGLPAGPATSVMTIPD